MVESSSAIQALAISYGSMGVWGDIPVPTCAGFAGTSLAYETEWVSKDITNTVVEQRIPGYFEKERALEVKPKAFRSETGLRQVPRPGLFPEHRWTAFDDVVDFIGEVLRDFLFREEPVEVERVPSPGGRRWKRVASGARGFLNANQTYFARSRSLALREQPARSFRL